MPLKITHRKEQEVPRPGGPGKVNENIESMKTEMSKLRDGMVLEIEAGSEKAIRGTKRLVTTAAKELGATWRHWSEGTKVFAKPVAATRRRRGRPRKNTR